MDEITNSFEALSQKLFGWVDAAIRSIPNLLVAIIVVGLFWLFARWTYRIVSRMFSRTQLNGNLEHLIAKTVKVCVIGLGFILALGILKLDKAVFSLLAGVGVIGLALGFAFQDLVSNFVSGVMIAIRSPFRVGDIIELGDTTGSILDIRLRDTVIKNFSGQHVLVPNKTFMTEEVTNFSTHGQRRAEFTVGVSYTADLREAKSIVLAAVNGMEDIVKDPAPEVYVDELGDSAVVLKIFFWVTFPGSNFSGLKEEAIIRIKEALDSKEIGIPYPTRTLDFPQELTARLAAIGTGSGDRKDQRDGRGQTAPTQLGH